MKRRDLHTNIVPQRTPEHTPNFKQVTRESAELNNWKLNGNNAHIIASVRFVQHEFQCFSDWSKQDMKAFWAFIDKIHAYSWRDLLAKASKQHKSGFAPTFIPRNKYPNSQFKSSLGSDIDIFELRVDNTKRIHGFRCDAIFYICWLDKNHEICN